MTQEQVEKDSTQDAAQKATDALVGLAADIPGTAALLLRGEFSKSGAGAAGIAYRAMTELGDAEIEDAWSRIISICASLWDEGETDAAIALIETAASSFHIPDHMQDRVNASTLQAKDFKAVSVAEQAFEAGEDDRALRAAAELTPSIRAKYSHELSGRIKSRQKTRKTAVWVAGVSISSLFVIAGIGVVSMIELLRDPPRPTIPSFAETQRVFDDIFSPPVSLERDEARQRETTAAIPAQLPTAPLDNSSTPSATSEDDGVIVDPTPLESASVSPESESGQGVITEQPYADVENGNESSAVVSPRITRDQCILGFAALQKASQNVSLQRDTAAAQRKLAEFIETLDTACSALDIDPISLSLEAGLQDPDRVEAVAQGIFN